MTNDSTLLQRRLPPQVWLTTVPPWPPWDLVEGLDSNQRRR